MSSSAVSNGASHLDFSEISDSSKFIYTPHDPSFSSIYDLTAQNHRLVSAFPSTPAFIATPFNEHQVKEVIHYARKHNLLLRIRSGGHDYEGVSYVSETPRFAILDLINFDSVSIDTEAKTAWIGAGCTLGRAYYTLAQKTKTLGLIAGNCPTVCPGGLFTCGGYSMMSRKYGTSADNVIDARIVDVNGNVLDKDSMGKDLFWAIRGGGASSFGVVLEWKVQLHDVPEIVTVFNIYRTQEQNATALALRWQEIADEIDEDFHLRMYAASVDQDGRRTVRLNFNAQYLGRAEDLMKLMETAFPELGLTREDCEEMSWIESVPYSYDLPNGIPLGPLEDLLNREPSNVAFKGKSDYVTQSIPKEGYEGIWERLNQQAANTVIVMFAPDGGILSRIPSSEIAFAHRAGNKFLMQYIIVWPTGEDPKEYLDWMNELYSYMIPYVSQSPRTAYVGYRDHDIGVNNMNGVTSVEEARVWGIKYYKDNFDKLVEVKTRVDPTNFFRNEQSIPPNVVSATK